MTSPLRIFVTADPELPVPPRFYGGIERIVAFLVDELMARGHAVTLFAHRASRVSCRLVPYPGTQSGSVKDSMVNAALLAGHTARRRPDVIHSFGRLAYLLPVLPLPIPKVMSYQREVTPQSIRWGSRLSAGTLHFTSCSQRLIHRVQRLASWHVIHNGVPLNRYRFAPTVPPDAPLVFLGRVEEIKGTHLAIDTARRAGRRLIIAGNIPEGKAHAEYFRDRIQPHVDDSQVTYAGPVDDAGKSDLLAGAAALLMPVQWDEPFGIVMPEALACGTPVIGLARGSVPEVIEDGVTGFVCRDVSEMVAAVRRLPTISRGACRIAAERRYSSAVIVAAYESLYYEITSARKAA